MANALAKLTMKCPRSVRGSPVVDQCREPGDEVSSDSPRLRLAECARISPRLPALIVKLRKLDRGDRVRIRLRILGMAGLLLAGFLGYYGKHWQGLVIAVQTIVLVGGSLLVMSWYGLTSSRLRFLEKLATQNPSQESVRAIADEFYGRGKQWGQVGILSRAVQWYALHYQYAGGAVHSITMVGLSASTLSHAMIDRLNYSGSSRTYQAHDMARQAHEVSCDALKKVRECAETQTDSQLQRMADRLESYCQLNERRLFGNPSEGR